MDLPQIVMASEKQDKDILSWFSKALIQNAFGPRQFILHILPCSDLIIKQHKTDSFLLILCSKYFLTIGVLMVALSGDPTIGGNTRACLLYTSDAAEKRIV